MSSARKKALQIKADREFWESVERIENERLAKVALARTEIAAEGLTGPCPWCGRTQVPVAKKHGWFGEIICLEHDHLGEVCAGVGQRSSTGPYYRHVNDS